MSLGFLKLAHVMTRYLRMHVAVYQKDVASRAFAQRNEPQRCLLRGETVATHHSYHPDGHKSRRRGSRVMDARAELQKAVRETFDLRRGISLDRGQWDKKREGEIEFQARGIVVACL